MAVDIKKVQKILKQKVDETSYQIVADEVGVSKTAIHLLANGKYPSPENIGKKVLDTYGEDIEILGFDNGVYGLSDAANILQEIG